MRSIKHLKREISEMHKQSKILKDKQKEAQRKLSMMDRSSAECPLVWDRKKAECFPENFSAKRQRLSKRINAYMIVYNKLTNNKNHGNQSTDSYKKWDYEKTIFYLECQCSVRGFLFEDGSLY